MSPVRLVAGACLPVSVVCRCFFLAGGCAVDDGSVLWVVSTEPGGWWELPGDEKVSFLFGVKNFSTGPAHRFPPDPRFVIRMVRISPYLVKQGWIPVSPRRPMLCLVGLWALMDRLLRLDGRSAPGWFFHVLLEYLLVLGWMRRLVCLERPVRLLLLPPVYPWSVVLSCWRFLQLVFCVSDPPCSRICPPPGP